MVHNQSNFLPDVTADVQTRRTRAGRSKAYDKTSTKDKPEEYLHAVGESILRLREELSENQAALKTCYTLLQKERDEKRAIKIQYERLQEELRSANARYNNLAQEHREYTNKQQLRVMHSQIKNFHESRIWNLRVAKELLNVHRDRRTS